MAIQFKNSVEIDQSKCIRCGKCIHVCPFSSLRFVDEPCGNFKKSIKFFPEGCIACMHCGSVCPQDALTFNGGNMVRKDMQVQPLTEEEANAVERLLYQRRSYRRFLDKEVPDELIEKALNAGMWGASAKNQHPSKWIVIKDRKFIKRMMELIVDHCKAKHENLEILDELTRDNNPVFGDNPTVIIAYCKNNAINAPQDTAIAITNAELVLQSHGVGTFYGGYLMRFCNTIPELRALLEIPEGNNVYGTLMIGYPDHEQFPRVPIRLKTPLIRYI